MNVWIIVLGIIVVFIGVLVYNYKKMQNTPVVPDHMNILKLSKKNFKQQVSKGVVLVDFWAAWCAPCKMMVPVLNELVEDQSCTAKIAKVNVEHEQGLAKKFSVRNIPTLIVLKDGKEVKRFAGFKTKKFLKKEIQNI
jgi:thioredoxin 1